MGARTRFVAPLLFGSGFCALIYQTTWLREFRLIFGSSTAATAAVVGVFMAGLGFGGILLGRLSESKAQPLAFYAKLELLIAISAGVSPIIIFAARHLYIALGGTGTLGLAFGTVFRLILAALIMGTPTFLMGGTLPAAARAVVGQSDVERRSIGALYGANTLGAVAGVAVGTFYCFENFGNRLTLWLAALLNIGIALAAFRLSRVIAGRKSPREPAPQRNSQSVAEPNPKFVLVAAWIVGFAFFLMELVWYRMLAPLLGGSTFSFGLILGVALLGIGLGGLAYGSFGLQRSASAQVFAITCAAEAFFIALPYALGDRIAMATMLLRPLGTMGFHGHVVAWTAVCSVVVLPAAFVSGLQFPLLIALLGKGSKQVGSQTGAAYAWNTIGALVGSLAGGFGFIPKFSAPGVWKMVIWLLCALSFVAAFLALRDRRRWTVAIAPVVIAVFAISMLMATGPTSFWRHSQIGTGHLTQFQGSANEMRDLMEKFRREIIWAADGVESSVALSGADGLAFIVNGRADGNAKRDAGTQVMLGLIGAALHPNPTKALVVGLGTGCTAGWLAAVPNIEKVDVVELEPAILRVAERCAAVNHNALLNPKVRVTIDDAREVLLTTREKYDLIVSEPSNPYRAGIASLFTKEYYQSVRQCLRPGGIFLQWVQVYDIDDRTMQIIYRTLQSVFPNVETWQTASGDLELMASASPVQFSVDTLRDRVSQDPFKSALLDAWQATGIEDLLGHYVGNNRLADTLQHLVPGPLNTDDQTLIEFSFARSLSMVNGFQVGNVRASAHAAQIDRPTNIDGNIDWSLVDESRLSLFGSLSRTEQNQMIWTAPQRSRAAAFSSYVDGDLPAALRNWRAQPEEPRSLPQVMMVAECLAEQGDTASLPYIDKVRESRPWDADAIYAELLWRQRRPEESTELLNRLLRALPDDPWPNHELIARSLTRAESLARSDRSRVVAGFFYDALSKPFSVFNNETDRLATRLSIATYLDNGQAGEKTMAAIESYEPHVVWRRQFLQLRKECYAAVDKSRAEQATRDLNEFMRYEAASDDVLALTKEIQSRTSGSETQARTEAGQ